MLRAIPPKRLQLFHQLHAFALDNFDARITAVFLKRRSAGIHEEFRVKSKFRNPLGSFV
jgi:hypothetical protein